LSKSKSLTANIINSGEYALMKSNIAVIILGFNRSWFNGL
jgi:hypothetical protein